MPRRRVCPGDRCCLPEAGPSPGGVRFTLTGGRDEPGVPLETARVRVVQACGRISRRRVWSVRTRADGAPAKRTAVRYAQRHTEADTRSSGNVDGAVWSCRV